MAKRTSLKAEGVNASHQRVGSFLRRGRRPTEIRRLMNHIAIPPRILARLLHALEFYQRQDEAPARMTRAKLRQLEARADCVEDWYRELSKLREEVDQLKEWKEYHTRT